MGYSETSQLFSGLPNEIDSAFHFDRTSYFTRGKRLNPVLYVQENILQFHLIIQLPTEMALKLS